MLCQRFGHTLVATHVVDRLAVDCYWFTKFAKIIMTGLIHASSLIYIQCLIVMLLHISCVSDSIVNTFQEQNQISKPHIVIGFRGVQG